MKYFSTFFTSKAIIAYFILLMICAWLFVPRFLPFKWIFFGILAVFSFFYFSSVLTFKWADIDQDKFQNKIFITALIVRIVYVVIIYFFYQSQTGIPFEYIPGDSTGYSYTGNWIVDLFYWRRLDIYFKGSLSKGISDSGWEITVALIYLLTFRSIMMVRIFNAFISALTVVLIYKISQRNFGEKAARITAILAILLPSFIYYSGLHLKETFMIFLLMVFIERSDYLIHSRNFSTLNIIQIILPGASLFLFRTVLGAAAWFSLFSALMLSSKKIIGQYKRTVVIGWLIIGAMLIFSGNVSSDISRHLSGRKSNQELRMKSFSLKSGGNKFAKYGSAAIFVPIIIPAPFPTLVNIPEQQNIMMSNGDLFTRNVYVFFVFIAFYILIKKKKLRENLLISTFLAAYLLILANSGFALSPRFHVPALPFLILFAGFGITQTNRTISSYYVVYLIGISTLVIAWNWFKLAGRGLL